MAEYIDREALLKVLHGSAVAKYPASFAMGLFAAADEVGKLPSADVVPVVHGRWNGWHGDKMVAEDEYRHYHYYSCNECGRKSAVASNYCPNCGARMDGE